jgi:hypothetical protein
LTAAYFPIAGTHLLDLKRNKTVVLLSWIEIEQCLPLHRIKPPFSSDPALLVFLIILNMKVRTMK